MLTANRLVKVSTPVSVRIEEISNFNPGKYFSDHGFRYSIMDNVSGHVLKNHPKSSYLPAFRISKISILSSISDKEIIENYLEKGLFFISPLTLCQIVVKLTEGQSRGQEGFLRTDGKKTIIGFLDHKTAITIYWCNVFRWVLEWHEADEWNQEVDLIIKKITPLEN